MTQDKSVLRRHMRQQRRALAAEFRQRAAKSAAHHVHKISSWSKAKRVALYMAQDGELDTQYLVAACRDAGKQLYLPVVADDKSMEFAAWGPRGKLEVNRFGIQQPDRGAERCAPDSLDIVAMPLVAWDASGGRLGMGGGFYDRTFADVDGPVMVGIAYEMQQLRHIERDEWDIPMDFVVTESALYQCRG
ncbi:MAG: 5-formyltetrahydrofolate cyclo-ligase [Pseudomonadota bacterium]